MLFIPDEQIVQMSIALKLFIDLVPYLVWLASSHQNRSSSAPTMRQVRHE
jgi:hypothetical protein